MHKQHNSERCIQFEFTLFDGPKPQEASLFGYVGYVGLSGGRGRSLEGRCEGQPLKEDVSCALLSLFGYPSWNRSCMINAPTPQKRLFWGTGPLLYRFQPFHWRVQGFLGCKKPDIFVLKCKSEDDMSYCTVWILHENTNHWKYWAFWSLMRRVHDQPSKETLVMLRIDKTSLFCLQIGW